MILAAGRGKRLRPITDGCPKPLIKVNQKPLIVYHLEALAQAGVTEVVINLCHLGSQISQTLGKKQYGMDIIYSDETGYQLETGGGIKKALPLLGDDPFLVVNGDIFCDYPYGHLTTPVKEGHLVMVPNPEHVAQGDFSLDNGMIRPKQANKPSYTYAGIACFKPSFFDTCQSESIPLGPLLRMGILNQTLTGELYRGFWMDIGTPQRLHHLDQILKSDRLKQAKG